MERQAIDARVFVCEWNIDLIMNESNICFVSLSRVVSIFLHTVLIDRVNELSESCCQCEE